MQFYTFDFSFDMVIIKADIDIEIGYMDMGNIF